MNSQILTTIALFVIEFFVFSIVGWCMEVTLKYFEFHRFINRGFLIGPYLPIYGLGASTITLVVGGYLGRQGTILETFFASVLVCGILEYFTSWYMEKLFHARWWDYSTKPLNINGRVWIGNLILFGIGGVAIVRVLDNPLFELVGRLSPRFLGISSLLIVVVMLSDYIFSHFLMGQVKKELDGKIRDNTEEIRKKVVELLKHQNILIRRVLKAYPCAKHHCRTYITTKINDKRT